MADKKPPTFVKEGLADLEKQKRNEQINKEVGELVSRKSLADQLRENSKKKRHQFQKLTKEKNSFTRLSTEDLNHINTCKSKEIEEYRSFSNWADLEEKKRLRRLEQIKQDTKTVGVSIDSDTTSSSLPSSSGTSIKKESIPTAIKVRKPKTKLANKKSLGIVSLSRKPTLKPSPKPKPKEK